MAEIFWAHNIDPVIINIGSFQIRYYGLFFAAAMLQGAYFWTRQVVRSGRPVSDALPLIWMAIFGVIIGGRIVHVLFYRFGQFMDNPLALITLGRGGFASHGSAAGILVTLWIYARRFNMTYLEALDRCSLSIPLATTLVRLGNFFNSEIVGRPTDLPWAVVFSRFDRMHSLPLTPRHPSQLYEAAIGIVVFLIVYLTDRRLGETSPHGLISGLLLISYFTLRFCVEFFKTYHVLDPSFPLTMGQLLCLPFILAGWVLVIRALRKGRRATA